MVDDAGGLAYLHILLNGGVHVAFKQLFNGDGIAHCAHNAFLNNDFHFAPVALRLQRVHVALVQVNVGVQFAGRIYVDAVHEIRYFRHFHIHFLVLHAHSHARQAFQLDHVHARDKVINVPARAALLDAFALLFNNGGIPFGDAREKVLERHQVFAFFLVFGAQFPRFVEN